MGSPVDLTLGCSTQALPSSNGCHSLRPGSSYPGDYLESLRKAEEYLRSLEDERRKVEGFKRELPLCIQLLEDAIQTSKEKLASGKTEQQLTRSSMDCEIEYSRPRLEEFMPLNMNLPLKRRWGADAENEGDSDGDTEGTSDRGSKRPAWMAEAQLWTQTSVSSDQTRHEKEKETEQFQQEQSSVTSSQQQQQQQLLLTSKERPTGAFLPFLREQPGSSAGSPLTVARPVPRTAGGGAGLSLSFGEPLASPCTTLKTADSEVASIDAAAGLQTPEAGNNHQEGVSMAAGAAAAACNGVSGAGSSSGGQSNRKARRCWSPELHRRFVSALHQLGGCQIATPKQIRELMKVDGLTNDEVKSHLQKYRLHTRRPSPSPQAGGGGAQPPPQLVVLGGIWVPPKYAASGSSQPGSSGVYDPTQHPPQFLPPDGSYFACISNGASGAPVQVHHHRQPVFEPQQAGSQSQCSPQGPLQVTSQLSGATQGPSSEVYHDESGEEEEEEEEEEAKSDSRSWKTSAERGISEIQSSSSKPTATTTSLELPKSNLNLQVACRTVQTSTGVNTASEEEVNQQEAQ